MKFQIYCDADFNPLMENYNTSSDEYIKRLEELDSRVFFPMDLGLFDFE